MALTPQTSLNLTKKRPIPIKIADRAHACVEDIDYRAGRGLDKRAMASLSTCDWIRHAHSVLITGATDSTTWYTPRYVTETAWKADWVHLLAESPAGCVVP